MVADQVVLAGLGHVQPSLPARDSLIGLLRANNFAGCQRRGGSFHSDLRTIVARRVSHPGPYAAQTRVVAWLPALAQCAQDHHRCRRHCNARFRD